MSDCDYIGKMREIDEAIDNTDRRFIAYVSGPYRSDLGEYHVKKNIRAAEAVAVELWRLGFSVICPHKNSEFMGGAVGCQDDEVWLGGDLELVRRSDFLVMVDGWQDSEGAQMERRLAIRLGIPVFYWPMSEARLRSLASCDESAKYTVEAIGTRAFRFDHVNAGLRGQDFGAQQGASERDRSDYDQTHARSEER